MRPPLDSSSFAPVLTLSRRTCLNFPSSVLAVRISFRDIAVFVFRNPLFINQTLPYLCMLNEYHFIYCVQYYPWFYVTAVGLGTYYPWVLGHNSNCVHKNNSRTQGHWKYSVRIHSSFTQKFSFSLNIEPNPRFHPSRYYMYVYNYIFINLCIFNCNSVDTRWQQYRTHLHTNSTRNTENGIYIAIQRKKLGSACRAPYVRVNPLHLP
jgi:hypothetical protein